MSAAAASSRTTHRGEEAAHCCRLLAFVVADLIARGPTEGASGRSQADFRRSLDDALGRFAALPPQPCDPSLPGTREPHLAAVSSVLALARSESQGPERDWNWRSPAFRYAPSRVALQKGYVGSYCMDAMAMALYRCYHSEDYMDAILRAAGMGGDADSVASIVGQIAGAYYGHDVIPIQWMQAMFRWEQGAVLRRIIELHQIAVDEV